MASARSYTELDAWNLANELKRLVYAFVASGPANSDETCLRRDDSLDSLPEDSKEAGTTPPVITGPNRESRKPNL